MEPVSTGQLIFQYGVPTVLSVFGGIAKAWGANDRAKKQRRENALNRELSREQNALGLASNIENTQFAQESMQAKEADYATIINRAMATALALKPPSKFRRVASPSAPTAQSIKQTAGIINRN